RKRARSWHNCSAAETIESPHPDIDRGKVICPDEFERRPAGGSEAAALRRGSACHPAFTGLPWLAAGSATRLSQVAREVSTRPGGARSWSAGREHRFGCLLWGKFGTCPGEEGKFQTCPTTKAKAAMHRRTPKASPRGKPLTCRM